MRRLAVVLAIATLAAALPGPLEAAPFKNILIIRGESPDLPGGRILIDSIEATVRTSVSDGAEFYIESIDTGRFPSTAYERQLADLLAVKYQGMRLDLVVAFAEPAVAFALREHSRLFAGVPMVLGLVQRRAVDLSALPEDASVVFVDVSASTTVRVARQLVPGLRRVLVVGGVSRFDRGWESVVREDLRGFDPAVLVTYDTDSPVADLRQRLSGLSKDTIVLYTSFTRDAAGLPWRPIDALESLHEVSAVPIFGISGTYVGHGSVGGSVIDFRRHGADLASAAVRALEGRPPEAATTSPVMTVDWREMRRLNLSMDALPPDSVVMFRERTLWERDRWGILFALVVFLVEAALIIGLVVAVRRRRQAQRAIERRLQIERLVTDLALSLSGTPPLRVEASLDDVLRRIARRLDLDTVWRWQCGDALDYDWESALLESGPHAAFPTIDDLPPTVQRRVRAEGTAACSARAIALSIGGLPDGALLWVSRQPLESWTVAPGELEMITSVAATVLQRKSAEAALEQGDHLKGAILDSLPASVAVLDCTGKIISHNQEWTEFAREAQVPPAACAPGVDYLRACAAGIAPDVPARLDAVEAIQRACGGEPHPEAIEHCVRTPAGERWFLMRVNPLRRSEGGAVVTQSEITERKLNEIALRESEDRYRHAEQQLRDVNRRLIGAQEDERRRIARELHDHLSQQLALLAIDLQQLGTNPPASSAALSAALQDEWRRTAEIASDVHAISHRLHPSKLESLGLVATLRAHCRDVSRQSLAAHFTERNVPEAIPADVALCLFRVAQEALTNVIRHSGAGQADVLLAGTGGHLELRVSDAGTGFTTVPSNGIGFVSMRERLQALGGTLSVTSAPGQGTIVDGRVPIAASAVSTTDEDHAVRPFRRPIARLDAAERRARKRAESA